MNCTICNYRLRITHTYTLASAKYQRAKCDACGKVHCLTSMVEPVNERGEGARARAQQHSTEDVS